MKHVFFLITACLLLGCTPKDQKVVEHIKISSAKLKKASSSEDSVSYAIGVFEGIDIGRKIDQTEIKDINVKLLLSGLQDGINGDQDMTGEEAIQFTNVYLSKVRDKISVENEKEGIEFLGKKVKEEGVLATESGLLYEIIKKGSGKTPSLEDTVTVHYTGTLIDGTKFDSSKDRNNGTPAQFTPKGVIRGWQEGLQLMQEGSIYKLYIPADLGYGKMAPDVIGPNAVLILELELIKVTPKKVEVKKTEAKKGKKK